MRVWLIVFYAAILPFPALSQGKPNAIPVGDQNCYSCFRLVAPAGRTIPSPSRPCAKTRDWRRF